MSRSLYAFPLRQARPEDVDTLVALDRRCFGGEAWPWSAWWDVVTSPGWFTIVADAGGKVVGALVLGSTPGVVSVASIAVAPEVRRQGLGRRFLHESVLRARGQGARWLVLEVDADNAAAIALYRGERFAVRRRFVERGRERLEMVRRLRSRPAGPRLL